MTQRTETFHCHYCGTPATRPLVRGQKPKWCSPRCAEWGKRSYSRQCDHCGERYRGLGKSYCSTACAGQSRRKPPPQLPTTPPPTIDRRTPLRRAFENGDHRALIQHLAARTASGDNECWVWQGKAHRSGYPAIRIGNRDLQAHRLMLEAKHGAPLGSQAAHHTCANTLCINPEHLQAITHRENIAEMLARQTYLTRIKELEAALTEAVPDHPLLHQVTVL